MLLSFLVILFLQNFCVNGSVICPPKELLAPCTCNATTEIILCKTGNFNLQTMFHRLSVSKANFSRVYQKFEYALQRGDPCVSKLPAVVFSQIKFRNLFFSRCYSLTEIDKFAFISMQDTLQFLTIEDLVNLNNSEFIFDIISTLPNMERFWTTCTIDHIPDRAFKNVLGQQSKLDFVGFDWCTMESVGSYAFYNLPNLNEIWLAQGKVKKVKPFAFAIPKSDKMLKIFMFRYAPSGPVNPKFEPLALAGINRPATIIIDSPKSLTKEAFSDFFLEHESHFVQWKDYGDMVCECSLLWLNQNADLFMERFTGDPLMCQGKNQTVWDLRAEEFGECK